MNRHDRGFTLIELMIVIVILAILAVVAIPTYGNLLRKSKDASTRGNLGAIRSAISIYVADTEGTFPSDHLECLTADAKYLPGIPDGVAAPHHPESNRVDNTSEHGAAIASADAGWWLYFNDESLESPGTPSKGEVWMGCTHPATDGRPWSSQ